MGAPIVWTAAWIGSRIATPRLIAASGAGAARAFGAETGAHIAGILNHFIVRNFIGAEVQHALRHLIRGGQALVQRGDVVGAEKEIEFALHINEDEVKKDIRNANEFVEKEANAESIEESAKYLAEQLRSRVPVRRGWLKSSVGYRRDFKTGEMQVGYGIKHRTRTAHIVELGARPHVIVPRQKKALAEKSNRTMFGRIVKHPGQRGQHILRDVMAGHDVAAIDTYKVKLNQKITERYGS